MKIFWLNDSLTFRADNPEERHALAILLRGIEELNPEAEITPSNEGSEDSATHTHQRVALSS